MESYQRRLRSVGTVLIVLGVVDIAVMIGCIAAGIGYSSSFNIFAVIAGVFLRRGSLKAARIVALFAAFFASGFGGLLLAVAILVPLDLLSAYMSLHPVRVAVSLPLMIGMIGLLVWVYRSLTAPVVLEAMDAQQLDRKRLTRRPSSGFAVGVLLVLGLVALVGLGMRGATAQRAKIEAEKQVGPGYKFFVSSLGTISSEGRTTVTATVLAYKPQEIQTLEVTWKEGGTTQ